MIISLTNIGDVLMSCPVIDVFRRDFPQAKVYVIVGPKAVSVFEKNPDVKAVVFDKHASLYAQMKWFMQLRRIPFDVVVDLRNTIIPFLLMPRYLTPLDFGGPFDGHLKDKHLARLRRVYDYAANPVPQPKAIIQAPEDEQLFETLVRPFVGGDPFVVLAPSAADSAKRWLPSGFSVAAQTLAGRYKVVFVGDQSDTELINGIQKGMSTPSLSLAGKTNLRQLAYVLRQSQLAITHDSGVMHLASYFDVPVVALFGPTNPGASAPWSKKATFVHRNENCPRCHEPKKLDVAHTCMAAIPPEDVLAAVDRIS